MTAEVASTTVSREARTSRTAPRLCVIGAGPSGIAAAKHLIGAGLTDLVVYERNAEVGGNWIFKPESTHSSVFETTHIISSKSLSQYDDFAMPADYPDYPGHAQLKAYFQAYARRFGVEDYVRFQSEVEHAALDRDGRWRVTLASGEAELFDHLLVANGHHWKPRLPDYPGAFAGRFLHAHDFKSAAPYAGLRVLVIGGGNSACDIAVETSRLSARTDLSMRRGYYIIPKFLFGLPTDVFNARFGAGPAWLRERGFKLLLRLLLGSNASYGLEEPRHRLFAAHPTLNSELLHLIRHGKIGPRRDVARFEGDTVHFADGVAADYDVVIAATGFTISFPFFDEGLVDYSGLEVPLYLKVFHPQHRNLFFIGLVQPQGCIWPLAEQQARLVTAFLKGEWRYPEDIEARIARELATPDHQWMKTPRHSVEVDYHAYRARLAKELAGARAY